MRYLFDLYLADGQDVPQAEVDHAAEWGGAVGEMARYAGRLFEAAVREDPDWLERGGRYETLTGPLRNVLEIGLQMVAGLGALHVQEAAREAGALELADDSLDEVTDEAIPFEEALRQLRSRVEMDSEEFYELADALRLRAFTAAYVSTEDGRQALRDRIAKAMEEGQTLAEFISEGRLDEALKASGMSSQGPWYWETVLRTVGGAAYNGGRWIQIRRLGNTVGAVAYVAIEDRRTTDVCRHYAGIVLPVDDAAWNTITPPNHFSCRSTVRPLFAGTRELDAALARMERQDAASAEGRPEPDEGFRASPGDVSALWELPASMVERAKKLGLWGAIQRLRNE